jgi:hypothetical protein
MLACEIKQIFFAVNERCEITCHHQLPCPIQASLFDTLKDNDIMP